MIPLQMSLKISCIRVCHFYCLLLSFTQLADSNFCIFYNLDVKITFKVVFFLLISLISCFSLQLLVTSFTSVTVIITDIWFIFYAPFSFCRHFKNSVKLRSLLTFGLTKHNADFMWCCSSILNLTSARIYNISCGRIFCDSWRVHATCLYTLIFKSFAAVSAG